MLWERCGGEKKAKKHKLDRKLGDLGLSLSPTCQQCSKSPLASQSFSSHLQWSEKSAVWIRQVVVFTGYHSRAGGTQWMLCKHLCGWLGLYPASFSEKNQVRWSLQAWFWLCKYILQMWSMIIIFLFFPCEINHPKKHLVVISSYRAKVLVWYSA